MTGAAIVLAMAPRLTAPAARADEWCWDGPVVSIDGRQVRINMGFGAVATALSPETAGVDVAITVPAGVPHSVVTEALGTYFKESVTWVEAGSWAPGQPVPVTVKASFTAPKHLPTGMQVTGPSGRTTLYTGVTPSVLVTHLTLN